MLTGFGLPTRDEESAFARAFHRGIGPFLISTATSYWETVTRRLTGPYRRVAILGKMCKKPSVAGLAQLSHLKETDMYRPRRRGEKRKGAETQREEGSTAGANRCTARGAKGGKGAKKDAAQRHW